MDRVVYLPLEKVDQCSVCQKNASPLKLCSRCGERIYCSNECQKSDWSAHKGTCGTTDRLDLSMFYPFLATLYDANAIDQKKPPHPAMVHTILNAPNPEVGSTTFPDGTSAKLIILGNLCQPMDLLTGEWWSSARTPKVRSKLQRRISREGFLLPKAIAVCMALLSQMYTTNWIPSSQSSTGKAQHRIRLRYRSSPIADFGIAKGEVYVPPQDELAYFYDKEDKFVRGQDPRDHYWFYFKTIRGEEVILDCGYYTFNMCLCIASDTYAVNDLPSAGYAPAYFIDRAQHRDAPNVHTTKERFSVLRNTGLHEAVKTNNTQKILDFMDQVAGRKCSQSEKTLVKNWVPVNRDAMAFVFRKQTWLNWPDADKVQLGIEGDPDEQVEPTEAEKNKMNKMVKLNRQMNRGEISRGEWKDAMAVWKRKVGKKA